MIYLMLGSLGGGGGPDTSATLQEWAFKELLKHTKVLRKATEELDRVIGRER